MYISYNILLCLPCMGPDLDRAARQVGFINNRPRLLDFVKNARQHVGNYFDYSFRLQD
jgi:hypothetical protein